MGNFRVINIGSGPSRGDGDQLRLAFDKINLNFSDLAAGNIAVNSANDTFSNSTLLFDNNVIGSVSDVVIATQSTDPLNSKTWKFKSNAGLEFPDLTLQVTAFDASFYYTRSQIDALVHSNIGQSVNLSSVSSDINPDITNTRAIGTPGLTWQSIYIGSGAIYLNHVPITSFNGQIIVNNLKANDTIQIGDSTITSNANILNLPAGTTMAGVSLSVTSATSATGPIGYTGSGYGTTASVQMASLGVGTPATGVAGEIRTTNNITSYYSDNRLQENITPIRNALAKVMQISGVTYNSNDLAETFGYSDKQQQVGVLAQELEVVLPHVVVAAPFDCATGDDGIEYSKSGQHYKTVRYERIIPLLIEAIKEQQQQMITNKVSTNAEIAALQEISIQQGIQIDMLTRKLGL